MQDLDNLLSVALQEVSAAANLKDLDNVKVKYLGKKGALTTILKDLKNIDAKDRPAAGQKINVAKQKFQQALDARREQLSQADLDAKLQSEVIDVSLPATGMPQGALHPVTKALERIKRFFLELGFEVAEGPEIEDEFYNFEALNIPSHHPARSMHDTFYFPDGNLLRTHTSPVQIRAMQNKTPPLRLIAPGRVYRCDSDLTHTPMFHQIEGFMVDENISVGNLKSILTEFLQVFFEKPLGTRFRTSYFPFTEPSLEVDMHCVKCNAKGCRICSHTGWLEILGCGMIHPNVLKSCGIDSEKYTGWAFGIGIDRLAMLRYAVGDLRLMFENDLRFLEQF